MNMRRRLGIVLVLMAAFGGCWLSGDSPLLAGPPGKGNPGNVRGKMGPGMMRGRMGRGKMGPGMMKGMMKGKMGPGMMGHDRQFMADRQDFFFLLQNYKRIRRKVEMRPDGVETWTETDHPQLVARLQKHVAAMHRRIQKQQPIRMGDPLFAEIFRHAKAIEMKIEKTSKGVHVTETSKDPYVTKLIQAHAKVVSAFVERGFSEMHVRHPVPQRPNAKQPAKPR